MCACVLTETLVIWSLQYVTIPILCCLLLDQSLFTKTNHPHPLFCYTTPRPICYIDWILIYSASVNNRYSQVTKMFNWKQNLMQSLLLCFFWLRQQKNLLAMLWDLAEMTPELHVGEVTMANGKQWQSSPWQNVGSLARKESFARVRFYEDRINMAKIGTIFHSLVWDEESFIKEALSIARQ